MKDAPKLLSKFLHLFGISFYLQVNLRVIDLETQQDLRQMERSLTIILTFLFPSKDFWFDQL